MMDTCVTIDVDPRILSFGQTAAKYLVQHYEGEADVNALSQSGIEIPSRVFTNIDMGRFIEMNEFCDTSFPLDLGFAFTGLLMMPHRFFDDEQLFDTRAVDGVQSCLSHMGIADVLSDNEIRMLATECWRVDDTILMKAMNFVVAKWIEIGNTLS